MRKFSKNKKSFCLIRFRFSPNIEFMQNNFRKIIKIFINYLNYSRIKKFNIHVLKQKKISQYVYGYFRIFSYVYSKKIYIFNISQ